jgi:biopolymer transport protein ExbB
MMYPLVLCSLIALGVMIAKSYTLWVAHKSTRTVLAEVEEAASEGRLADAAELASAHPGPTAAILVAGLRRISSGEVSEKELASAIRTTGTIELGFLERGLVILATVANVAPLMGFLGTVIGMIIAFASIEAAGDVDATLVAGGIKVALLTTATGLLIAIPVNIGYNFFVTRIDTLILDMEQGARKVLDLAYGAGQNRRLPTAGAGAGAPGADAVTS